MGWDGIDELKAQIRGWTTRTCRDLPFRHHRLEGARDGRRWRAWAARGRASHYMGYRGWYLILRAIHHARTERAALGLAWGYVVAVVTRAPRCTDEEVRAYLRDHQRLGSLGARRREAVGLGE